MRRSTQAWAGPAFAFLGALASIAHPRPAAAKTDSDVSIATVAVGRLYVLGTTEKPNTPVTLDKRFHTTSDETGHFTFEEIYHPATCIVGVDIEARTYRAVVSNCAQQAPVGTLPFVGANFPGEGGKPPPLPPRKPEAIRTAKPKPPPRPKPASARPATGRPAGNEAEPPANE